MKPRPNFFRISKTQQKGLILLISILIGVEILLFFTTHNTPNLNTNGSSDWKVFQAQIDSLKNIQKQKDTLKIYPFNPNYITSYRGYVLGLSPQEIQRMMDYRKQNKFVNSPREFQKITQISDSLLQVVSPYLKFPKWTSKPKKQYTTKPLIKKSLNEATAEDLKKVYGIGSVLADRIIQFRNVIGGFIVTDQLRDVYGLEDATIINVLTNFEIKHTPKHQRLNINTASIDELNTAPYITYSIAREIVIFRTKKGKINAFEEIDHLDGITPKIRKRIPLYLYIDNGGEYE